METEVLPAPKTGSGFDMAPLAAVGGVAVVVMALLLVGGYGVVANALEPAAPPAGIHAAPPAGIHAAPATGAAGKNMTDGTGTSTAGPTAPPERGSAPTTAQPADTVRYIHWGDTLSQISLETGVSVDRLAQHNAIPKVDLIYAESVLRVPYILIPGQETPAAPAK